MKIAHFFHKIRQKKIGLILVSLGAFLIIFVVTFLYIRVIRVPGFAELLPAKQTAAFFEADIKLDRLITFINKKFGINSEESIQGWMGDKAAVAFLQEENQPGLNPYLLLEVHSLQNAFDFIKNYRNQLSVIKEKTIEGIQTFSTPAAHFTFFSDVLVLSPSESGLAAFVHHQSAFTKTLRADAHFKTVRENVSGPFFAYARGDAFTQFAPQALGNIVPQLPIVFTDVAAVGIAGRIEGDFLKGKTYSLRSNDANPPSAKVEETSYKARLLSFIPEGFDLFLSGTDIAAQIKNIQEPLRIAGEEYLPGISVEKEIAPLLTGESALTIEGDKVLFITETDTVGNIETLRTAFLKAAARLSPAKQKVTLPDGTKAQQLMPDASGISEYKETFHDIEIHGMLFGRGEKSGLYEAVADSKWFISNDLPTLKKSVILTKEPGRTLRDSQFYKDLLRPILKNPQLLGIAKADGITFSFSKREEANHIETNFILKLP